MVAGDSSRSTTWQPPRSRGIPSCELGSQILPPTTARLGWTSIQVPSEAVEQLEALSSWMAAGHVAVPELAWPHTESPQCGWVRPLCCSGIVAPVCLSCRMCGLLGSSGGLGRSRALLSRLLRRQMVTIEGTHQPLLTAGLLVFRKLQKHALYFIYR